jgi:hypothetical protein
MKNIFKNWWLLLFLIVLDRIITIYMISQLGLLVEINPLMNNFYPYGLIILPIPILILTYYYYRNSKELILINLIWFFMVLFNLMQFVDYFIGLQSITYIEPLYLI